jgi:hypothetical protein
MEPKTIRDIVAHILTNQESLSHGIKKRDSLDQAYHLVKQWEISYRKIHNHLPPWYDNDLWWETCYLLSEELDAKKDVGEV